MKIGIGNDHAAVELKNIISEHLKERGCEVVNFGTDTSESFDYPIAGYKVGKAVANGDVDLGILICGTGVGLNHDEGLLDSHKVAFQVGSRVPKSHSGTRLDCIVTEF